MREIKFRAWDGERIRQADGKGDTGFYNSEGMFPDEIITLLAKNRGWEWMQYTGIKDKNGKEIYEGDIIRTKGDPSHVLEVENLSWALDSDQGGYSIHDCEVIGNIYENPELETK